MARQAGDYVEGGFNDAPVGGLGESGLGFLSVATCRDTRDELWGLQDTSGSGVAFCDVSVCAEIGR